MQQHAQKRQLDLLMLAADDGVPRLFNPVRRAEIVSLLKALLSDRRAPVRILEETDDD
ncbi:hypothetical protein [Mesorhizobium amorphae]|nr:hypothetical protein [Mesorhizobium amorphae]